MKVTVANAVVPFIAKQLVRWKNECEKDLNQKREPLLPVAWVSQLSAGEATLRRLHAEVLGKDKSKARSRL